MEQSAKRFSLIKGRVALYHLSILVKIFPMPPNHKTSQGPRSNMDKLELTAYKYPICHLEAGRRSSSDLAQCTTGGTELPPLKVQPDDHRVLWAGVSLSFLWTGSQIPIYMLLSVQPYIIADIGGSDISSWFTLAPTVALAAICPFVGNLADLVGRRWSTLFGAAFLIAGLCIAGTAQNAYVLIAGTAVLGVGAGISELNALAGVSEIAPNKDRGKYASMLLLSIIPFLPLTIYAQELAVHASWRWTCWIALIWNGIGIVLTYFLYNPPPRAVAEGFTKWEILRRMDHVGGLLSVVGLISFMLGLTWGGYQYPWISVQVLVPLIFGIVTIALFCLWEHSYAAHPLFPRALFKHPRVFALTMLITAISGANFISLLSLWPTFTYNVFSRNPEVVGLMGLSQVVGILSGAVIISALVSVFKGQIRPLIIISATMMTVGITALAGVTPDSRIYANLMVVIGTLGVGGIVVPASIITALVSPDELIGTVTALTLTIRVLGGSIGYAIYYNRLIARVTVELGKPAVFMPLLKAGVPVSQLKTFITAYATQDPRQFEPLIATNSTLYSPENLKRFVDVMYEAARPAWALAFKEVWLITMGFGIAAIACSVFLGDVGQYMTEHTAVHLGGH